MLNAKKVAILLDDMYEDSEFIYPYYRLLEAGVTVDVVGKKETHLRGKHGTITQTTAAIHNVKSGEYDALFIPGGYSPDGLRMEPAMVSFVKELFDAR